MLMTAKDFKGLRRHFLSSCILRQPERNPLFFHCLFKTSLLRKNFHLRHILKSSPKESLVPETDYPFFSSPCVTTNISLSKDESDYEDEEEEGDQDSLISSPVMDLTTSMDPSQGQQQEQGLSLSKGRTTSTSIPRFYSAVDMSGQSDHTLTGHDLAQSGLRMSVASSVASSGNLHDQLHLKIPPVPKASSSYRSDFESWEQQARASSSLLSTSVGGQQPQSEQDQGSQLPSSHHPHHHHHQQGMTTSSSGSASEATGGTTASGSGMMSPTGSTSSLSMSACDSMSPAQMTLAQLRKRKRRPQPIPEDCKDDAYWERRKRNNESAKRSREMRRMKEQQTTMRVIYLEQDNLRLKTEVDMLRTELEKLREILYNRNNVNFH